MRSPFFSMTNTGAALSAIGSSSHADERGGGDDDAAAGRAAESSCMRHAAVSDSVRSPLGPRYTL